MESIAINGTLRTDLGKKAAKAYKRAGKVVCVIYGGEKNVHFSAVAKDFKPLLFSGDFKLVNITVDGATYQCILKAAQFHPVTDEVQHLDFLQLVPGQQVKVELPLKFRGVAPGVKAGGKLIAKVRKVKIKTTPEHLVDSLFVDISGVNLSESVRVRDIELGEGMEIMNAPGIPVASVEVPRALKSADAAEEEEAAETPEAAPAAE